MLGFLADPPRFLFLTGKGGVGKTSIACATGVLLASQGKRVLLVSTDPASNVGQVFDVAIGGTITDVPGVPGLQALEIDPEEAAEAYRERIIGPVRGLLPDRDLASITEQLSGSCTTEVASFNEFTALLADSAVNRAYDHIIFDTAPTGHTIRLLQLPGSWTDFLDAGKGDASCLGPLAGLDKQRSVYAEAVAALKDRERTRLILVARPQDSALAEVSRTNSELADIGIHATHLVVNGVMPQTVDADPLASAIREREYRALTDLPPGLLSLERDLIELKAPNMIGLSALRALLDDDAVVEADAPTTSNVQPSVDGAGRGLAELVDAIEQDGHGLVMCMGKGGVGKTTIAAAIAVALAHRGHHVHLTTTDPAAHVEETLHGSVDGLRVTRIDPVAATRAYREHVMETKGQNLDEVGRANLMEDLLSPCTEEVAVFRQFSEVIREGRRAFVVVDTAPTGHTLLLLDAAGSYHRDIVRQMGGSQGFRTPMMMLQDPSLTKVVIVTLPEPTPVTEARVLQDDLERAGIHPWAWVVNNSLAAAAPTSALLQQRAAAEMPQLTRVESLADRVAVVPMLADEPVGESRLLVMTSLPQTVS